MRSQNWTSDSSVEGWGTKKRVGSGWLLGFMGWGFRKLGVGVECGSIEMGEFGLRSDGRADPGHTLLRQSSL